MSILKDIERVGDHAKELLRLARVRGPFSPDTTESVELTAYSNRIAGLRQQIAITMHGCIH